MINEDKSDVPWKEQINLPRGRIKSRKERINLSKEQINPRKEQINPREKRIVETPQRSEERMLKPRPQESEQAVANTLYFINQKRCVIK